MRRDRVVMGIGLVAMVVLLSPRASRAQGAGSITDARDGHVYPTITLGTQTWLARNLVFDVGAGSRCLEDRSGNCERYGRLYAWQAAVQACPTGWHLPTEAEWQTLERFLGLPSAELDDERYRGDSQGRRLLRGGDTGMDVVLAGYMRPDGTPRRESERAAFWTATQARAGATAWHRDLSADPRIYRSAVELGYYLSVRCVADPSPGGTTTP